MNQSIDDFMILFIPLLLALLFHSLSHYHLVSLCLHHLEKSELLEVPVQSAKEVVIYHVYQIIVDGMIKIRYLKIHDLTRSSKISTVSNEHQLVTQTF